MKNGQSIDTSNCGHAIHRPKTNKRKHTHNIIHKTKTMSNTNPIKMLYRVHFAGFDLTTLVVIGTNCTGSWKHFRYCFLRMLFTFFFFISANVNIRLRGYWLNTHRVLYLWTLGSPYHNNDSYRIQFIFITKSWENDIYISQNVTYVILLTIQIL